MLPYTNSRIHDISPYSPGQPIEGIVRELGISNPIKLASNENPHGPSRVAIQAIRESLSSISRYPDSSATQLRLKIANYLDIEPNQITLGNGSNDVLELATRVIMQDECHAIVDEYCFLVYPLAVKASRGNLVVVSSRDWGHDLSAMLAAVTNKTRLVFIANPNNPTGTWINESTLRAFLSALPKFVWTVLDEAYFEYANVNEGYPNGVSLLKEFPQLIVTRTFSKIFGLAALRVGYAVSSSEFAELMNRVRQPFNVNSIAQSAAEAALVDEAFIQSSLQLNMSGMKEVCKGIRDIGMSYIPSAGNFITFDCFREAMPIYDALLQKGIIVRPVSSYGMPNHLRVSIGLPEEVRVFLQALREVA